MPSAVSHQTAATTATMADEETILGSKSVRATRRTSKVFAPIERSRSRATLLDTKITVDRPSLSKNGKTDVEVSQNGASGEKPKRSKLCVLL